MRGARQALRLCPDAVVVSPRFDAYTEASRRLFEVFRDTSPVVEGLSLEEAFLDVAGLERISGGPVEIAERLRSAARERVGLAVSVGIGSTKAVAKMASNAAKPDGLLEVPHGGELAFLHPLPVEKVWGVGPATAERLRSHGVRTVGEIAAAGREALVAMLGPARGHQLHALAHNRDPRPVRRGRRRRSVGAQSASVRPTSTAAEIDAVLVGLVDRVTRRMRSKGRTGRTVVLRMRRADFTRASRSRSLPRPTAATAAILAAARGLLAAARPLYSEGGLTLVGITVTNLSGASPGSSWNCRWRPAVPRSTTPSTRSASASGRVSSRAVYSSAGGSRWTSTARARAVRRGGPRRA